MPQNQPALAVLTELEKNRIRHHLGYLVTAPVASIQLGVPRASEPQFLVEFSMNSIPVDAIGQVRRWVAILDSTEETMVDAQSRLAAKRVGNIEMREDELDSLEREYRRWAQRLADDLGVPLNIYSERFRGGLGSLNIPVAH